MLVGGIIGLVVPQLTFWVIYFGSLNAIPLNELVARPGLMSKMLALSLIGNLLVFMLILKKFNNELTARGILMSTFAYGLVIAALKVFDNGGLLD